MVIDSEHSMGSIAIQSNLVIHLNNIEWVIQQTWQKVAPTAIFLVHFANW